MRARQQGSQGTRGNAVTLGSVGAENLKKPQIAEMFKDKLSNKLKVLSADEVLRSSPRLH